VGTLFVPFLYTFGALLLHFGTLFGALCDRLSGTLSGTVFTHYVLSMGKNTSIDGAL
jgi:hypothetical protein